MSAQPPLQPSDPSKYSLRSTRGKSGANWNSRWRQLQYCNFWPGTEADGRASGSDASVDVQLAAAFFVPSAHVGSLRVYEGEAPVDERERQLAAVAVPGKRQLDAQFGGAIKAVGIVAQKDVDHVRHHQFFTSLEIPVNKVPRMISGKSRLLIVNADQVQHFAVRLNGCPLLTEDANPLLRQRVA